MAVLHNCGCLGDSCRVVDTIQDKGCKTTICSAGLQLLYCDMSGNQLNGSLPSAWSSMAQVSKSEANTTIDA